MKGAGLGDFRGPGMEATWQAGSQVARHSRKVGNRPLGPQAYQEDEERDGAGQTGGKPTGFWRHPLADAPGKSQKEQQANFPGGGQVSGGAGVFSGIGEDGPRDSPGEKEGSDEKAKADSGSVAAFPEEENGHGTEQ